ncbi:MAG: PTS sugar transporter subunit IIA [Planctomycetota bacterium]|nr:PTS sugar transporter subunit IIA [Planctomycetota bacterium]MDP6941472.1 PTS sugar transporter subunit IIA [Planctomycetota bacterium]
MTLDLRQAAAKLGVSPDTLQRWARQGQLGMRRPGGELRFQEEELESWARKKGLSLRSQSDSTRTSVEENCDQPLIAAISAGGLMRGVEGETPAGVLKNLVEGAPLAKSVDRSLLLERLLEREKMTSTGMGHGIALPHPRTPSQDFAMVPTVVIGLLQQPVDWMALDGERVHTALLLLSPNPKSHLQLLSRVAFILRDSSFCKALAAKEENHSLLVRLAELEPCGE